MSKFESSAAIHLEALRNCEIDIEYVAQNKPEPIDFVVPGLAMGSFGVTVAAGGAGKSMFWLQTAVSLAIGYDHFGLWSQGDGTAELKQGASLVIAAEDPQLAIKHRLHAALTSLPSSAISNVKQHVKLLSTHGYGFNIVTPGATGFETSTWMKALATYIEKMASKPRLVVFDTLNRCLGQLNENAAGDMSALISALESLCARFGCAVMVLHHTNRASSSGSAALQAQASRGSSALPSNARFQMNLWQEEAPLGAPLSNLINVSYPKSSYCAPLAPRVIQRDANGLLWGRAFQTTTPSKGGWA